MTRKYTLMALVPALVLGMSACGSSDAGTQASPSPSAMSSMPMPSESSTDIESADPSAGSGEAVISIADFTYTVPASVAPGAQVGVTNSDSLTHTVTSKSGGFDVKVDPGGTATFTAPSEPGRYPFACNFHGNMTSTLVVQ